MANNSTISDYYRLMELQGTLEMVRLVASKIYSPIICFVGLVINVLNIVVLSHRSMATSTNTYLTAVSVYDSVYLCATFFYSLITYESMRYSPVYMHLNPYVRILATLCSNTTAWLTVSFTIERFIAVCFPVRGYQWCTILRARKVVLLVGVVTAVHTVPLLFTYGVKTKWDSVKNSTRYEHVRTHFHVLLTQFGYSFLDQAIFLLIPLVLLMFFNSCLLRAVIHSYRFRGRMPVNTRAVGAGSIYRPMSVSSASNNHTHIYNSKRSPLQRGRTTNSTSTSHRRRGVSEQRRTTLMLIAVVLVFIVFQLPSSVPFILTSLETSGKINLTEVHKCMLRIYGNINNALLQTGAAMNFVLYSLFSVKFRDTFRLMFSLARFFRTHRRPVTLFHPPGRGPVQAHHHFLVPLGLHQHPLHTPHYHFSHGYNRVSHSDNGYMANMEGHSGETRHAPSSEPDQLHNDRAVFSPKLSGGFLLTHNNNNNPTPTLHSGGKAGDADHIFTFK